jgi:hypothetical protein
VSSAAVARNRTQPHVTPTSHCWSAFMTHPLSGPPGWSGTGAAGRSTRGRPGWATSSSPWTGTPLGRRRGSLRFGRAWFVVDTGCVFDVLVRCSTSTQGGPRSDRGAPAATTPPPAAATTQNAKATHRNRPAPPPASRPSTPRRFQPPAFGAPAWRGTPEGPRRPGSSWGRRGGATSSSCGRRSRPRRCLKSLDGVDRCMGGLRLTAA